MVIDVNSSPSFIICYASQKGNAQAIAEEIFDQCLDLNLNGKLYCISKIQSIEELKIYSCTIFVASTTGDGDPPDTAIKFIQDLKARSLKKQYLSWLQYTILGLGDSNYTNFCNFGKTLHKHLQSLRSVCFYENGWADDGTGLEVVVEPWIEGLPSVIKHFLKSANHNIKVDEVESIPGSIGTTVRALPVTEFLSHKLKMSDDISNLFPSIYLPSYTERVDNIVKKLKFEEDEKLTLPTIPATFLIVTFCESSTEVVQECPASLHISPFPSAASAIIPSSITSCYKLSKDGSLKKTLELSLHIDSNEDINFEPGDSFGIVVHNPEIEVNLLLHLLNVEDKADIPCELSIDPATKKRGATVPQFIGKKFTVRQIFTYCLDFRVIPKKPFIRALIEFTQVSLEKIRLMEFVSKEGSNEYNEFVRFGGLTFLDLLILFESCKPPLELVFEHLPRLLPRPYSITSSPLVHSNIIKFVFNVIEIPQGNAVTFARKGICTGWLDNLTKDIQDSKSVSLVDKLASMSVHETIESINKIYIYLRSNNNFRLPKEITTPIIMVGPGTGVAPFIGFLEHRLFQIRNLENKSSMISWLLFGCRHKNTDFIYQKELESFISSDVLTKLLVCFSRDEGELNDPKYVQDNIISNGEAIIDLLNINNASVYVCGDAKNMSKNVFDAFHKILQNHLMIDELEARKYLAKMQINNRYLQDVWS